jgi:hypothetical protein
MKKAQKWQSVHPNNLSRQLNSYQLHSSLYNFVIKGDANEIIVQWQNYFLATKDEASILGKNCAVAAEHITLGLFY